MEIISRKEAKEAGMTHYFTGKPCKRGHVSPRFVSTMVCMECGRGASREWARKNPVIHAKRSRDWQKANKTRRTKTAVKYVANRKKKDPVFRMKHEVRSMIATAFTRSGYTKSSRTHEIIGCSWDEFKSHIERQFLPGMSWENRHLWHIDHITPLSTAKTKEDVVALNHVSNLRPIWAEDNIAKKDKLLFLI